MPVHDFQRSRLDPMYRRAGRIEDEIRRHTVTRPTSLEQKEA